MPHGSRPRRIGGLHAPDATSTVLHQVVREHLESFLATVRIPAESNADSGASRTPVPSKAITRSEATRGSGLFLRLFAWGQDRLDLAEGLATEREPMAPWTSRSQIASPRWRPDDGMPVRGSSWLVTSVAVTL